MNSNPEETSPEEDVYTQEDARRAHVAEDWHRGASIGLVVAIALYLIATLAGAPHWLSVVGVVASFVLALAYMGTTLWVYSLKTERKREARARAERA